MDGNGRWAVARGKPRVSGHHRGVEAVRDTLRACGERGIEYLTLFAFSSENWRRPADEVSTLMKLFVYALQREVDKLIELGVRAVVGDLSAFDAELRRLIVESDAGLPRTAAESDDLRQLRGPVGHRAGCEPRRWITTGARRSASRSARRMWSPTSRWRSRRSPTC
jgi:undecaprenyl diphosphate synthase